MLGFCSTLLGMQTKEVMNAMTADVGLEDVHCLRVDGGASTNDLLMQLQADLLQVGFCQSWHNLAASCPGAHAPSPNPWQMADLNACMYSGCE